ncbi:MAG: LacI family DNA-binding transcriptional regulator [Asticcacaulis sp.]
MARIAGVSVATVSRALNDSPAVNRVTKRRVWKIARDQNYVLNQDMPMSMSGSQATIAIVIPPPHGREGRFSDPFYQEMISGVGEAARDMGCDLLLSHLTPRSQNDLAALMQSIKADGVIFLGQSYLHDRFNHLANSTNKFIVWGQEIRASATAPSVPTTCRAGRAPRRTWRGWGASALPISARPKAPR